MNNTLKVLLMASVLTPVAAYAANPVTATLITKEEIAKISATEQSRSTLDQNSKVVDIGDGYSMELGVIHRGSTHKPPTPPPAANAAAAAERKPCGRTMATAPAGAEKGALTHDSQTEGYYIVSGGGVRRSSTLLISSTARKAWRTCRSDGGPNGPTCGGLSVGSHRINLKVGDVLIVPPGVVHGWADIPDHVDYLSFRPSHGVMKNGWVNPIIAAK